VFSAIMNTSFRASPSSMNDSRDASTCFRFLRSRLTLSNSRAMSVVPLFQRMPVPDAAGTRRLLERMLGLRACVRKRREVWLYKHARIHLDTVERLGRFIEIEVVVTDGMARARALMKELTAALGIDRARPIAGSYGDMRVRTGG